MSIFLFVILFIFGISSYEAAPLEKEEPHSNSVLAYWAHLVKDEQAVRELVDFESKCAEELDHLEILEKDDLKDSPGYVPVAPMTLFPSAFPRHLFDLAEAVQPAMNLLYFRASRDYDFLVKTFKEVAKQDKFIGRCMEIVEKIHQEGGHRQPIGVQVERADYMVHVEKNEDGTEEFQLKQIEVNVANGGGSNNAIRQTKVHRKVLAKLGLDSSIEVLRDNHPYMSYAEPAYLGWLKFGDPEAIMVITFKGRKDYTATDVQKKYGKRAHHFHTDLHADLDMLSGGKMQIEYLTMEECDDRLTLDPEDFTLRLDDGRKVGIVLYRWAGSSDKAWSARLKIERSTAVKSPTVAMNLLGAKRGQQALAEDGVVERYFPDPAEAHYVEAIRNTFAGLWSLENDDEQTQKLIQDAMAHPEKYVLKPNKDGGGHNFFDQDLVEKLQSLSTPSERSAFILMQRLNPMTVPNYFIRSARAPLKLDHVVPELGIYGGLVGDLSNGNILFNHQHGYMIRTKKEDSPEGGIWEFAGVYDSPYLY